MSKESIKVVCISDLHGTLPNNLVPGDILCITGDIVPLDIQRDSLSSIAWLCGPFFNWIESLSYEKVLFVWGNHDFVGEYLSKDSNENYRKPGRIAQKLFFPKKLHLLNDSEFVYEGFRFYGSPWCPDLKNWAFYKNRQDLLEIFSKIPEHIDVLLTHCAPMIKDFGTVLENNWNYLNDFGCYELATYIEFRKPRLSVFGHIHSGDHVPANINGTVLCNCSIKSENYESYYDCKVFTITKDHIYYNIHGTEKEL